MSKGFSVTDILGEQSKANSPAGQPMKVVMLPIGDIQPNPQNAIYEIGDVGMLQADIAEHGLRTPLEVAPAQGGKYMLIAGHRRHTACLGLHDSGDMRFDLLPCVITDYGDPDEELVALITSNATARELTDGERLRQYEALKGALTRLKAEGKVDGRVREELARRTGEGSGTLARLNAISARCIPEVKEMLEKGEITFTRAYECSKLYKVQQVSFAKNGWAPMPSLNEVQKVEIIDALVKGPLKDFLSGIRYSGVNQFNYTYGKDGLLSEPFVVACDNLTIHVEQEYADRFRVVLLDPQDKGEELAESSIYLRDMFINAKRLYQTEEDRENEKQLLAKKQDNEKARKKEQERWYRAAQEELHRFDEWKKVAQSKELGLVFREYVFVDGGRMIVAVDEKSKNKATTGMDYDSYFAVRLGADGTRVHRDTGEKTDLKFFMKWEWKPELALRIAEDLQARAQAESVDK